MRHLMGLSAALLSCSMLATTAFASALSDEGLCRELEDRLERCDGGARLSTGTQASCDRTEEAYRVLCGALETIVATESADSGALDLLRQDYEIVPIEDAVVPYLHLVIGPDDLADPDVADLVRQTYRAGKTVAMTFATADEVRRFHRLVYPGQAADCVSAEESSGLMELYGLQESLNPPRTASYCLRSLNKRDPASDQRWLRERFATTVPDPSTTTPVGDASSIFLTAIASSQSCQYTDSKQSAASPGTIKLTIFSMRSLDLPPAANAVKQDFYLVTLDFTATPRAAGLPTYVVNVFSPQEINGSSKEYIISDNGNLATVDFATPFTSQSYTNMLINDQETTTNGTIGYNGSSVTGQVSTTTTTKNEQTITVPEVVISNILDTATLEPGWTFTPQSANTNSSYDTRMQWVWQMKQGAYPLGGEGSSQLSFFVEGEVNFTTESARFSVTCNVTVPYPVWDVEAPVVNALSPNPATTGAQVTIQGSDLYPNIVTNVLINGSAIPASNINGGTATDLSITVPAGYSSGPVQVNTTAGNSTNNPTLTIDPN